MHLPPLRKWFLIACLLFGINSCAQSIVTAADDSLSLAFPGAEGFGRFTSGGRGGKVLIVDKLSDHPEHPEPGSLRWAVNQKGARIIVFSVSGTIELEAPLTIRNNDLTIAGQSAPGDGICIKNYVTSVQASNVIIRYIRFRCGVDKLANAAQDALNGTRQENVIIDHCSMSWSVDEASSFYDNKAFTMQWCIISESLFNSGHEKGEHGYGGIWGGMGASFHHNLIAHHTSRNPRFNGARFTSTADDELVDFRNNVIFNWGYNSIYGGEGGRQNIVNNYFKPGPATPTGELRYRILDLTQKFYDPKINKDTIYAGQFFVDGNIVEGYNAATKRNWEYGVQKANDQQKKRSKALVPFSSVPVQTSSADQAYEDVLTKAGARLPKLDAVDQRIIHEVRTGICAFGGKFGAKTGIIDKPTDVGGWPSLQTQNVMTDTDKDGLPDAWEKAHKLNPADATDASLNTLHKQYTNIEIYLNELTL